MDEIDDRILKAVKEAGTPITTYKIVKDTGMAWLTVYTHCYRLRVEGKLKMETKERYGRIKHIWGLP